MTAAVVVVTFVLAYLAIALEHPLGVNKAASALLGAGLLWTIYALALGGGQQVGDELSQSLMVTAQIVFFLMGAMTIVEVVDAHNGFEVITERIKTKKMTTLVWLIAGVTFFLSAILDNLTTTIVMVSLVKKLLARRDDRLFLAGIIIIAANAGGAWSPIGDVTTTMLWIGGQITAVNIVRSVFWASLVNLLVPLAVMAWLLRGQMVQAPQAVAGQGGCNASPLQRNVMFFLGLGILLAVPGFKMLTGLPPFMGVLLGLGLLWLVGDLMHRNKDDEDKEPLTLVNALTRIDMASIIFFVGILLAVSVLEHTHVLAHLAQWLNDRMGRMEVIVMLIGLVSAVVDNVPLVAASMGMYDLARYPADSFLWEFLAYCAGTGGSILVIGSAAGVAAMGLERIEFFWYLRKIGALALLGYLAGALVYIVQYAAQH